MRENIEDFRLFRLLLGRAHNLEVTGSNPVPAT
jgi:hypothetical protein